MKDWSKPHLEELDVELTASGSDPSATEQNGYFSGGWHNATYDATTYEKCERQGSVTPKKHSVES